MDSQSQNALVIVQSKFSWDENVKNVYIGAIISESHEQEKRILAIVEKNGSLGFFVIISTRSEPTSISDLTIERAIPIDRDFKFEIDTEPLYRDANLIPIVIKSSKIKLNICLDSSIPASDFGTALFQYLDEIKINKHRDYSWIQKYNGIRSNMESGSLNPFNQAEVGEMDSPDIVIPRQKIAQGCVNGTARDAIFRYQMAMKENDYTHLQDISVLVATWNVNGQPPVNVSLRPWLAADATPPDVYAIGFQELDLSKETFIFNETRREEEWREAVVNSLHPGARYRQVALVRLVGMMLIVFVRYELFSYVSNVATDTVGTGIMGKMGNKGGVGIRLDLHNTSLCFVNSHLAAHTEEVERRNQDYHDIYARMSFVRPKPHTIRDHDQIYWLGDLNYRITELSAREVKERLSRGEMDSVLIADQLNQQHTQGKVLTGYTEGRITFQPTYKYDPGTDHYDTSEKARAPAWCDRILWKGKGIEQNAYRSHPELRISDHKPVSAVFTSQIRVIDVAKYRKIHEEVLKKMDKLENEFLPQVTVDRNEIFFGTVRFMEPLVQELIIANTGQVPVQFEFIKKLDDTSYCKDWLRINPYNGEIKPGEKCDIMLEVQLKSAEEELYDILVLHLNGGKDVFITVKAKCQRSSFTTPLTQLCRLGVPVAYVTPNHLQQMKNGPNLYGIPRELFLLVDHLYRHGLKTRNLFERRAIQSELIQVRDWLDSDGPDPPPTHAYVVAEALLLFLLCTPEPVIPHRLLNQCIASGPTYAHCKQIVSQLPEVERNVFLYVCLFLQELLHYSADNGADAKTLSTIFGDVLLRSPIPNPKPQASRSKAEFVHHFLVNDHSDLIAMNR
ncbi:inositol polyphosphate 5-phosphatase OCRL isoform X2 [Chrysoperla carnea]|uniref:inositol polyphosphate 5-phosphatase OCRL isoform X2 n=1 Tax=Chrysoperla carnea TaxID=189513 RepID=UPI001D072E34|nr:inositol polyphosphate 5-phosphatase OCRL isoform X2 [Chrysoperla carnea]